MSEIVNIVHELSFELGNTSAFQDAQTRLESIRASISKNNTEYAAQLALSKGDAELQAIRNAGLATESGTRAKLVNDLKSQNTAQNQVNTAAERELGIIQKLNYSLQELKLRRERATSPQAIAQYNSDIKTVQGQLTSLQGGGNGGTEGGLFAKILGINNETNVGRSLLQGVLRGFAVGSGFGVVTRLTDEIIKLGIGMFDTDKQAEDLNKHTQELISSFQKETEELIKLDEAYRFIDVGIDGTTEALKRQVDAIKAKGVVQGEVFAHQTDVFKAEQAQREEEQRLLAGNVDTYTKIRDLIDITARSLKNGVTNDGSGGNYKIIQSLFKSSGLDQDALNKILLGIKKTGESNFNANSFAPDENNLTKALLKVRDEYNLKIAESDNKRKDKTAQISDAEAKFNSDLAKAQYDEQLKLTSELESLQLSYYQLRQKRGTEYLSTLENLSQKELNIKLQQFDRQRTEEAKVTPETPEITKQLNEKRNLFTKQSDEALLQEKIQFAVKLAQAEDNISIQLNKSALGGLSGNISGGVKENNKAVSFADYKRQADLQNTINEEALFKKYSDDVENAKKISLNAETLNATLYKLTIDFGNSYENLQHEQFENQLQALQKYYDDVIQTIEVREGQIISKQLLGQSETKLGIASRRKKGRISQNTADFLNSKSDLQTGIGTDQTKLAGANQELVQAQNLKQSDKDNGATDAQLNADQQKIDKLQKEINDISADIDNKEVELKKLEAQHIASQIASYANLATTVLSAYATMNDAHEKYVQTEISIESERLNQANVLAQRGNTAALLEETKRLNDLRQQQELYARRAIVINQAIALSNEIVAVSKAVADYGIFSPAAIAAILGALVTGFSFVSSLQSKYAPPAFKDGGLVTGPGTGKSDSIHARLSNGEFVTNAEATSKNRGLLEHINKYGSIPMLAAGIGTGGHFASHNEMKMLGRKLDGVIEAVENSKAQVHANVTRDGIYVAHTTISKERGRAFKR